MPRQELDAEALRKAINKKFGEGTLRKASDSSLEIVRIPTGILSVDYLLDGGIARNRFFELYGDYGVGKTYIALHLIANAQLQGLKCLYVDVENAFNPEWAAEIGVDLEELDFASQDEHGNRLVNVMEAALKAQTHDVIVLDSIASLLPIQETENDAEKASYGAEQAKLMSQSLRRLVTANRKTAVVMINQTREKLGVVFGSKVAVPGGRAQWHYAGVMLEVVKIETLKGKGIDVDLKTGEIKESDSSVVGHRIALHVQKNKIGGPQVGQQSTMVFNYEHGMHSDIEDLMYLGRIFGLIKKKGDKWSYNNKQSHGRKRFKAFLLENEDSTSQLEEEVEQRVYPAQPA